MWSLLFIVIGFVLNATLESCSVEMNTWQFWVIIGCVLASIIIATVMGGE